MSFWKQIAQAVQGQLEDFFNVPWPAITLMLVVIIGLIDFAYVRTVYGVMHLPPFWGVHVLLRIASFVALVNVRRLVK